MKIGIAGAPGSGKSTLAARLYAELKENGFGHAAFAQEYARQWVADAQRNPTFDEQRWISSVQGVIEADLSAFDPIVCDSCLWLGGIYAQRGYTAEDKTPLYEYLDMLKEGRMSDYDITIFVPLFSEQSKLETGRIHSFTEAYDIQRSIVNYLDANVKNVVSAPHTLAERAQFIKDFVNGLSAESQESPRSLQGCLL